MPEPEQLAPKANMFDLEREIRFATVIYGGVSLAIYINGIVQEMLHLVRSTAADKTSGDAIPWRNLSRVERIYRLLSTMVGAPASQAAPPGKSKRNHRPGTAGLSPDGTRRKSFSSLKDMVECRLKLSDDQENPI